MQKRKNSVRRAQKRVRGHRRSEMASAGGSHAIELEEVGPPPVQLVFEKVSIEVTPPHGPFSKALPVKRILDEVSGIFGPAECIACMGPSGSGKTTMLNALTGVTRPTHGTISANGQPFDAATMRRFSALVPQDDLLTPTLTVHEALMEAALFKSGLGLVARQARVEKLLEQFGLGGCRDVRIGHPDGKKGISGGQKRRLSVALELCGTVSLLYLDEPTSGLDAVSTMALVRLLSSLARGGVTVIATIHQPSAAAFFTFDRLLLLDRGAIAYQGPVTLGQQPVAFFEAAGFPCAALDNPADFLFEILVEHADAIRQKYVAEGVPEDARRAADASLAALEAPPRGGGMYASTFGAQLRAHARRNAKAMVRNPMLARLRCGSAVGMGLAMGILYFELPDDATGINERVTLLLFTMLFFAIINALPVVVAVLPELAVVRKEARNNW